MLSYPSGMTMSSRAPNLLADLLRGRRAERGTRWRKLPVGRQALLVVAHLRKNDTYAELACGFGVGTSTVYRYVRGGLDLLTAKAPTLEQAIEIDGDRPESSAHPQVIRCAASRRPRHILVLHQTHMNPLWSKSSTTRDPHAAASH